MALELDAPPDQVRMPGSIFTGTVADATDAALADQLQNSLDVIQDQLSQWDAKHDRQGYAPKAWYEIAAASRPMHNAESAVRRHERIARAIRKEQTDRQERAKAQREADIADTRARLDAIVSKSPDEAKRAIAHAADVMAASERVRAFVADLELMGGSTGLGFQIDRLRDGAAIAADALGLPAPDMPSAPDGLPTITEVQHVMAVFLGRGGFDATFTPKTEAGKADDLARKLKKLDG